VVPFEGLDNVNLARDLEAYFEAEWY